MEQRQQSYAVITLKMTGRDGDILAHVNEMKKRGAFDVSVRYAGGVSGKIQAYHPGASSAPVTAIKHPGSGENPVINNTARELAEALFRGEKPQILRDSSEATTLSHELCDAVVDLVDADVASVVSPVAEAGLRRRVFEILSRYSIRPKAGE